MKVVHINGGGETGGGKSHLVTLLPELRRAGCDASLIVFSEGLLAREARAAGIPTTCLGVSRMMSLRLFKALLRLLREQQPDIVHTHGGRANLYGRLAARLAGVRCVVTTVHSYSDLDYGKAWHNTWFSLVDRLTWSLTDRFIAVSRDLGHSLNKRGVRSDRVAVVHNGITPWEGSGIALAKEFSLPAGPIICAVGRFVAVKRFDVLLQAMAIVQTALPAATLLLVGEGPLLGSLEALAKHLKIEGRVIFTGYRRDARAILSSADVFVMSSDMEGLPIVLLEALSAGVPMVATAVGGIPEVVWSGETALLVPRGHPQALAEAISTCLQEREAAKLRAARSKQWFLQHGTAQAMSDKTLALYKEWSVVT
ncbi:MAG: glycosyltransferase [Peptococcaceae bacterium]|nr:glycosyltransferase [Peptococcaceae bacterium]